MAQAYLSVEQKTSIVLDASQEKKLQLNFNVTLYHLPCRFATLDIVDVMGTHFQNVPAELTRARTPAPWLRPSDEPGASVGLRAPSPPAVSCARLRRRA